ncbi:MAG: methionyl-tRNA formyltransferase [Clostridia bacterium]|nr:methionyl-tRNA formyltransferase [Clostridia bacterium]
MRVLFMGTPDIAATALSALLEGGFTVVGAVSQPDRPRGRGMTLTPPPVKVLAKERGIPVYQPESLRDGALLPLLDACRPDVIAVVAYGKILPEYVLNYPAYGCINLHVSLLPRYRGAAPMQRAIMAGERETGVCTMQMDAGLDTGDVLLRRAFPISDEDNFETVHDRAAEIGGALLCETLKALKAGTVTPQKQDASLATYAEKITKEDCVLDFTKSARVLFAQIRGLSPIPLSFTKMPDGKLLKVVSASLAEGRGRAGEILRAESDGFVVACGEGALLLRTVLPEGKGRMNAADLLRGRRVNVGDVLGNV